jgi:Cupin-like domain
MASPPKEAWCAAHLNMLCNSAIRAYDKYGLYADESGNTKQRGFLINYDSLPGIVGSTLLPAFGVQPTKQWLTKMATESQHYSKGKGDSKIFQGDSEDKDSRATDKIQKFAASILAPTFDKLTKLSEESFSRAAPALFSQIPSDASGTHKDWKFLNKVPEVLSKDSIAIFRAARSPDGIDPRSLEQSNPDHGEEGPDERGSAGHRRGGAGHSVFDPVQFVPWAPFSNTHSSKPFERPHCPLNKPPEGYPKTYSMLNITGNWNTDSTEIPPFHFDSICHFDYRNQSELDAAYMYRKAEVPFIVYNIPAVDEIVKKWNDIDYLQKKLGKKTYRTETSKDNHFMYWRSGGSFLRGKDGKKWKPPTGLESVTFEDWLELAVKGQNKSLESRTHQYFRVSSDTGNEWLFNELPFFKPVKSLFLVNPREQRGIHCRFGMRSIIAEAHFDGSRNSVVVIGGLRRWILAHPDQCVNMHMLPNTHPSGRHSEVDWSKPDLEQFPNFAKIRGNEVILQPGDFLYVPTYWIHYIVSLNINYQCNTRSGKSNEFDQNIRNCGF